MSSLEIITRKEAIEKGLNRYFTGKECSKGHLAPKLVSNRRCTACSREHANSKEQRLKYKKRNPDKVKDRWNNCRIKYKIKHRDKVLARNATTNGLRDKKLKRQPCVVCGELKVEGHHQDYMKPLEVIWLCAKHHREIHNEQ